MIYDHEVVYLIRIVIHLCKLVFTTKFDYWSSQPVHRSGVWRSIVDLYWGRHDFVNPANEPSWRVFRWPPHSNHILDFESTSVISTTLKTTVIAALLKIWCITFRFDVNSVLCVLFFIWHFGVCDSEVKNLKLIAKGKKNKEKSGGGGCLRQRNKQRK